MNNTFKTFFTTRYGIAPEGRLNSFISREHGRVLFADLDLQALAAEHGAPLEVVFCPLITQQVQDMQRAAADAQARAGYAGAFVYAYASKANFAEEAVRTALDAGVHYETSSVADVMIATELWRAGTLRSDRYVFCNGSKEDNYIDAILRLRRAGNTHVVPVVDDLDEWAAYRSSSVALEIGVRARDYAKCVGGDRFGLLPDEIREVVDEIASSGHRLVLYHAMVGSQLEDQDAWLKKLEAAVEAYCQLRQRVPSLRMFNFGGGMPTAAYALDFQFDYAAFMEQLFATIKATCARYGVPVPDVVGEFGRYTVASHSAYVFEVGKVKRGRDGAAPWYLIDGSLMVSAPDTLIVDQQFIVLPLNDWDKPAQTVQLGGRRTCDSDDVYPRPGQETLVLPHTDGGLLVAVFGVGAYQAMLGGKGGAHHCLNPEMTRVIVEQRGDRLVTRVVRQQSLAQIKRALGYEQPMVQLPRKRRLPVPAVRRDMWRTIAQLDSSHVSAERHDAVLSS